MTYTFRYNDSLVEVSPPFVAFVDELKEYLSRTKPISNENEYNILLAGIDGVIRKHQQSFVIRTPQFETEIAAIDHNPTLPFPDPMICTTPWGGVVHKFIDVDGTREQELNKRVRKLLVIRQRGILGFEIHKEKDEHLEVTDGAVLFIASIHGTPGWKEGEVLISLAEKGTTTRLLPGDEHGMIALTNAVVEERSTYHLTDLIFLYNTKQVI